MHIYVYIYIWKHIYIYIYTKYKITSLCPQNFPEAKNFSLFEKKLVISHFFTLFKIVKSCLSSQLKLKVCALLLSFFCLWCIKIAFSKPAAS